jgi:hypothetical protein
MKRADARRLLLTKYLRSSGPVTLEELSARFGWTARESRGAIGHLVRTGAVAEGDFVPDRPRPQFCWQANLEALHRETLKRLRSEIEPLSIAELQDFLLRWQHVHPSTRLLGQQGMLEVLRQLEGYGTYPLLWKRDILSARVDGFEASWLHECIERGALVFGRFCLMGTPSHAPGAGTVLCEPIAVPGLLVEHTSRCIEGYHGTTVPGGRKNRRLVKLLAYIPNALERRGATAAKLARSAGASSAEVEVALWELYTQGVITNTSPASLLDSTITSFLPDVRPAGHPPADCQKEQRRLRQRGLRAEAGLWVLCRSIRGPQALTELSDSVRLRQRLLQALRMLGIASASMLAQHLSGLFAQASGGSRPLALAPIRQACQELVHRGEAVKGFFVRELAGEQYALPNVPGESRRTARPDGEPMVMVSSLDPASLYISRIPVSAVSAYCFPGRFVVLDEGRLTAVIDQKPGAKHRFVASNIHLPEPLGPEDVCRLIDAVADFAGRSGCFGVLDVRAIANGPATGHPVAAVFRHRGFDVSGTRLWIPLNALGPWERERLPRIGTADASRQAVDPIARLQAVLEHVVGAPIARQRSQGRTVLKYKGRMLANWPDGKGPVLWSAWVGQEHQDLLAAIPTAFKRRARGYEGKWGGGYVEVPLSPQTDFDAPEFGRLAQVWVDHLRQRLARASRKRKKANSDGEDR